MVQSFGTYKNLTKRITIFAGKNLSFQYNKYRCEFWTIVKGEGVLLLNGQFRVIRPGDIVEIPVGSKRELRL